MIVRAIDTGYGLTKYTLSAGPRPRCGCFPSLAVERQATVGAGVLEAPETLAIEVEGVTYDVGPDVDLTGGVRAPRILHDDYVACPEYLALTRAALTAMQLERIDLLVVGLPVSLLAHRKARLVERLRGRHPLPGGRAAQVDQVLVLAQPLGGLIHYLFGLPPGADRQDKTRLLLDPGSRTFDWTVARGLKEVKGASGSHPGAVAAFLAEIARRLSDRYGIDYTDMAALDQGLRTGEFHLYGQPVDLAPLAADAAHALQPSLTALANAVGDGRQVHEIVLVGGGAFLFQSALARQFPHHRVIMLPDALFANVRGFQRAGEVKAARWEPA